MNVSKKIIKKYKKVYMYQKVQKKYVLKSTKKICIKNCTNRLEILKVQKKTTTRPENCPPSQLTNNLNRT